MQLDIPSPTSSDPTGEPPCHHRPGCSCRRPYIGWALITGVVLEVILALVTVVAGAPAVGLVACTAIGGCTALAVVAEIVAFYRVGLTTTADPGIGRNRGQPHRPGQSSW